MIAMSLAYKLLIGKYREVFWKPNEIWKFLIWENISYFNLRKFVLLIWCFSKSLNNQGKFP